MCIVLSFDIAKIRKETATEKAVQFIYQRFIVRKQAAESMQQRTTKNISLRIPEKLMTLCVHPENIPNAMKRQRTPRASKRRFLIAPTSPSFHSTR
jgi:hypothetical protein